MYLSELMFFIFFGYLPRVELLNHGSSIFTFLMNLHTVLYTDCTNFHFHQQCTRIPFSLHPGQHLLFIEFLIVTVLPGKKWYLVVFD